MPKAPLSPIGLKRRDFLKFGPAAAATFAIGTQNSTTAASDSATTMFKKRPNIVFVFSDEHRWQSLPFTEMPECVAPNMTKLAQQGTRFDNCCATAPVCTPFRGILITGQWPHQSGYISNDTVQRTDAIGVSSPTIAHMFKDAGYKTGYVGKWHLKNSTCQHAGFDTFKHWLYGDEHWETEVRDIPSGEAFKTVTGYNAIGMTDQAIDFVNENADGDQPFMLMLSLNPPHWRWDDSPEEFYNLYPDDNLPYRPNVEDKQKHTPKQHEFYRHYHGHISAVDRELGRMMDALDAAGIADDTILIYTSDHGSSFGSNGVYNKGNPYDEAVRVPFIVRWPGKVSAGAIADHNLGTIDLVPTLCGLAGFEAAEHCAGQDFTKAFLGQPGAPDPESQFLAINNFKRNYYRSRLMDNERTAFNPFRAVRGKRYTFAVDRFGDWFLYDNKADPFQLKNLADDPAYAKVRDQMAAELDAWLAKAEDPFIDEAWRGKDHGERIRMQNEYYSLEDSFGQWEQLKNDALAPYLAQANAEQTTKLEALGNEIFDLSWFGQWKALDYELTAKRRGTDLTETQLLAKQAEFTEQTQTRLAAGASKILG
ncbi:sulfatase family protein [Cerasicoccus maritimus]|uniref:sulfatase family protein n=1 Tax=Cerasicoccus maritimus TaxID=490089 RepID=UPI002852A8A6|nr:sulfatase [Cerasicoccus maritimus]